MLMASSQGTALIQQLAGDWTTCTSLTCN